MAARLAVDRSALRVDARQADEILARQEQVLMAEEYRINAVELGEILTRVFLPRSRGDPGDPRVTEHDDQIDAASEVDKLRARGFDDVDRGQAPADVGLVPLGDLWRRHADHAYCEPLRRSVLIEEGALDHVEGGNQGEPSLLRRLQQTTGKPA
jgi:hypothetical protein